MRGMNLASSVIDPTETQAELLGLARDDADLLADGDPMHLANLIDSYWEINKIQDEPPLDRLRFERRPDEVEASLRALYEAAVRDALDLPDARRDEVLAASTPRVVEALLGGAS